MHKAILNGQLIDDSSAVIPISDKAYFFDFAVYSSLKVVQGKVFFPQYHVQRLFESAKLLDLFIGFTQQEVVQWINKMVEANGAKDALLRITLVGDADNNKNPKLFIFPVGGLTFYPDKLYKKGAKVITYHDERTIPQAKTKDLLMSFLAYREAKAANALDALLVDRDGNIREGTRTNFFAIKGNMLFTPPAGKVLEGITKKIVLEACQNDFDIKEQDIPLSRLSDYDEFFITSTSMNVMPIRQVDDMEFKTEFAQTKKISKLFKEYSKIMKSE